MDIVNCLIQIHGLIMIGLIAWNIYFWYKWPRALNINILPIDVRESLSKQDIKNYTSARDIIGLKNYQDHYIGYWCAAVLGNIVITAITRWFHRTQLICRYLVSGQYLELLERCVIQFVWLFLIDHDYIYQQYLEYSYTLRAYAMKRSAANCSRDSDVNWHNCPSCICQQCLEQSYALMQWTIYSHCPVSILLCGPTDNTVC